MMITRKDAVKHWAEQWRTLKAWPCSLADITVDVRNRKGPHSTGRAVYAERRIVVSVSSDMPDSLATVLHEFAHAARPRRADIEYSHHDDVWQELFANAVHEVTGIVIPEGADNYKFMDDMATDAVRTWWKRSGHENLFFIASQRGCRC